MKRGYPRPQMRVEKCSVDVPDKARWSGRSYPVPYSARTDKISRIHYGRINECITYRKCIVCGNVVDLDSDGNIIALLDRGRVGVESGPFHEKCARLTANLCPVIARDEERKKMDEKEYIRFGFTIIEWRSAQKQMRADFQDLYNGKKDEPNT